MQHTVHTLAGRLFSVQPFRPSFRAVLPNNGLALKGQMVAREAAIWPFRLVFERESTKITVNADF